MVTADMEDPLSGIAHLRASLPSRMPPVLRGGLAMSPADPEFPNHYVLLHDHSWGETAARVCVACCWVDVILD